MKKLYIILLLASVLGCKEQIEEQQQNIIIQAMTNGEWTVTSFLKAGTNVTTDFSPYKFKFNNDYTVNAITINNGMVEKGTWNADASAKTITSNFPNASTPLSLLNGTWNITNNSWTWVEATKITGSETHTLRLDKQ